MDYAKLDNGKLTKAVVFPNGLSILNGRFKRNPTEADILAAGYLPIEDTAAPDTGDGYIKSSKWVQTDKAIVKKWNVKRDMRPLSQAAVSEMLIRQQINTMAVDDNTALRMRTYYPEWAANTDYTVGYKVQRNGKLWRAIQPHTSQDGWQPENSASLWEQINETHDGTLYDAIPYDGNMSLESGKHYTQDGVVYCCTRDTGNPVYHALAELVGNYVEAVE